MKLSIVAVCFLLFLSLSNASLGPSLPPCVLVNHKTEQCIDESGFASDVLVSPSPDLYLPSGCYVRLTTMGFSPYVISNEWTIDNIKKDCTAYPAYSKTTMADAKEVTLESILRYVLAIAVIYSPVLIIIAVIGFLIRRDENSKKMMILMATFGIASLLYNAVLSSLVFAEDMPPLGLLFYNQPIALLTLFAMLAAIAIYVLSTVSHKEGEGQKARQKKN